MPECQNLDGMNRLELGAVARDETAHPEQRRYAKLRLEAHGWRASGAVHLALQAETKADRCYRRLPAHLQW